jgi:hypothetical protein
MWLSTTLGFYSIVKDLETNNFKLRARAKKDLKNLINALPALKDKEILTYPKADYRHRIIINQKELEKLFEFLAGSITYGNFKDAIAESPTQKDKLPYYHDVWEVMWGYQEENNN